MGAYVSDDIKAQARVMLTQGLTPREIGRKLGVSHVSVYTWQDKWLSDPELEDADKRQLSREYRIIDKAHCAIEEGIDYILEAGPALAAKSLFPLNAVGGTLTDKQFKRKELALRERDISRDNAQLLAAIQEYAQSISPGSHRLLTPGKETHMDPEPRPTPDPDEPPEPQE